MFWTHGMFSPFIIIWTCKWLQCEGAMTQKKEKQRELSCSVKIGNAHQHIPQAALPHRDWGHLHFPWISAEKMLSKNVKFMVTIKNHEKKTNFNLFNILINIRLDNPSIYCYSQKNKIGLACLLMFGFFSHPPSRLPLAGQESPNDSIQSFVHLLRICLKRSMIIWSLISWEHYM